VVEYIEERRKCFDCCANHEHLGAVDHIHRRSCENLAICRGELIFDTVGSGGHIYFELERDTFELRHGIPGCARFIAGDNPEPGSVLLVQVLDAIGLDIAH